MTKESYNFGVDTEAKRLYTETSGMTAKRFQWVYIKDNLLELRDNGIVKVFNNERLEELLNEQHEQIQELQMRYDAQRELYCELDCVKNNLYQENEQLKQQLNYIQNSISEHIKHQKTELGQKALKEIIEDYNEWLLGHKELKE